MLVNQLLENSEQEKASEYIQHITEPDEIAIPFIEKDDYLYFQKIFESKSGHSTLSTTTFNQLKHTWKLPGALSAMLNYYRATLVTPAKNESDREQLRQVVERYKNMPSIMSDNLCIWGKEDPYFTHECFKPQSNDTQSLGRIHFLCIENCGHWIPHEKPNIVLEQILCC